MKNDGNSSASAAPIRFAAGGYILPAIIVLGALLLQAGCGAKLAPIPPVSPTEKATRDIRIAVLPLNDLREVNDKEARMHRVPLILFAGYAKSKFDVAFKSRVEKIWRAHLSQRLAEELQKTGAFKEVLYTTSAQTASGFPMIVKGDLELAEERGTVYSYGLSFLMRYVWYLGLPKFTRHWDIKASFEVVDTVDSKEIFRSRPILGSSSSNVFWIYSDEYNVEAIYPAFDNIAAAAAATIVKGLPAQDDKLYAALNEKHAAKLLQEREAKEGIKNLLPPEVLISRPTPGSEMRQPEVDVIWNLTAFGGLRKATMTLNDTPVALDRLESLLHASPAKEDAPKTYSESTPVQLDLGSNRIEIEIEDHLKETARAQVEIMRYPKKLFDGKRMAIIIGLSSYSSPSLPSTLPGAKFAKELKDYLTDPFGGQMGDSDVIVLTDAQATRDTILKTIKSSVENAVSSYDVVIYFSGYSLAIDRGGPGYLLAYDTNPDDLEGTAVSCEELREILGRSLAANTIFIADGAYKLGSYEFNAHELLTGLTRRVRSLAVIASTQRAETLVDYAPGKLTFSEVLLRLLKSDDADLDKDQMITMRELVDKLVEDCDAVGLSTPSEDGRYDRDMPLKMLR